MNRMIVSALIALLPVSGIAQTPADLTRLAGPGGAPVSAYSQPPLPDMGESTPRSLVRLSGDARSDQAAPGLLPATTFSGVDLARLRTEPVGPVTAAPTALAGLFPR